MTARAANPYDQFDAPPASPAGASSPSANPYDQFDPAAQPPPPSVGADIAKSTAAGLAQGVYAIPGQLGDLERGGKWLMDTATEIPDYGMLWAQGKVAEMAGGLPAGQTASDWATQKLAQLNATREGVNAMPSTAEIAGGVQSLGIPTYQPQTVPGRYASTIASFVPQTLLSPEKSAADIVGNAVKHAVAPGIASETAGQLTSGTPLEPWARGIAAAGTSVGIAGAEAAANAAQKFAQPFTKAGQEARAASDLAAQFTDPQAAQAELAKAAALQVPGTGMGEIVPGSRPTTGQLTGDLGALSTEREIATAQPTLFKNNQFGTGSEQQNAARTAALGSIQSEGDPAAVSATLRDQLSKIEAAHDQAVTDATTAAQTAGAKIGTGAAPEDVGEGLRGTLQAARDTAKTQERALWNAVDPDGMLALPAAPIATGAAKIAGEVPSTAKPMSGEEAAIFDTAANLPAVAPFSDITALRSRISAEMRQELMNSGQSYAYNRLSQLRGTVEDAITNAATHKAAADQTAVASGQMAPADTLGSRIASGYPTVQGSDVSGLPARKASNEPAGAGTAAGIAPGGMQGPGNLGPRDVAGGPGIPRTVARPESQVLGPGKVYYPSGSLDVNYELANLPDLITSHDADFRVNPQYPAELQPRARESAPARDQVNSMAARLQPERLGPSPEANSGAPIVGPDNVVESGNGRTLALAKAYQAGRGGDYRNWLESQGIDTAGIARPVLVARRVTPLTPADRGAFAHSANTASGLRMNAAEQAAADARLITPDALGSIADGKPINATENRTFVRSFLSQLPASERGGMLDAAGNLSQTGVRRMEAAMASRAYGDGDFVARAFDAADPNIRGLAGGMVDASGPWMKMRQAAREGLIDPDHDVTPDLMNAARAVMRARAMGRPVSEVINQGDLFGAETTSLAKKLILNDDGAVAARDKIAARLQKYADQSQKNLAGPNLFGDKVSPAQVLKTSVTEPPPPVLPPSAPKPPTVGVAAAAPAIPWASAAMKPGLKANLDEAAAARLTAASAATKARAATFDVGPVGQVLRKAGNASDYRLTTAAVPGKLWQAGPKGAETVGAYAGAAGPSGMSPIHDAAAESLRREAMTPEGIIDPVKFTRWQSKYQDALRAMPADLKAKFSTAAGAGQAVEGAAVARKAAVDGYQKSAAGKFLGLSNPQDVTKTVSGILGAKDGVRQMTDLAKRVASDPVAVEGLRKAVADAILAKATSTTEHGASGIENINAATFQKFLRDNSETIKAAGFSDLELGSMQVIAQDLQRGQRTLQATRLPGQSNTAQDIVKSIAKAGEAHHVSLLTKLAGGAGLGWETGGIKGALAGAALGGGEHLIGSLRDAGIAKANTLVRDALLNPELALALLKKAPIKAGHGSERTLAGVLAKTAMLTPQRVSVFNARAAQ